MQKQFSFVLLIILLTGVAFGQTTEKQAAELQTPSGGQFAITKSVIAGGGREMSNAPTAVNVTSGQTSAGVKSTGGQFSVYSGFWTPETFAPTASVATVGGRVFTDNGRPIRNVSVTMTYPDGQNRTVLTGASGYYRFADVTVGATYIFSVSAKRFTFSQSAQTRTIVGDEQDINFTADPAASNENP